MSDGVQVKAPATVQPLATKGEPIIEIENVTKVYQMGEMEVSALRGVSLKVIAGEYVAIVGASGSGKSTLMNVIGLLDRPTSGTYRIRGTEVSQLGKNLLADLRNREIGFVFQRFNLLARTSARRQVELPLFYSGVSNGESRKRALEALGRVGLGDRANHRPDELSGGQQQRVAIARALVNRPHLLLADEPTGALDSKTGAEVLELFDELNRQGITLVVVTHDWTVANRAQRIVTLSDGLIIEDRNVKASAPPVLNMEHSVPSSNNVNGAAHVDPTIWAGPPKGAVQTPADQKPPEEVVAQTPVVEGVAQQPPVEQSAVEQPAVIVTPVQVAIPAQNGAAQDHVDGASAEEAKVDQPRIESAHVEGPQVEAPPIEAPNVGQSAFEQTPAEEKQ